MIKAVAYARYSSDNQRDESIDAQLRAIQDYAAREGYSIIDTYTDEALTATTDQRPSFLQMIEDAKDNRFQAVLVHKLDRFSRDRYDSAIYKRKLKESGVSLVSVLERIDGSPESIILESVLQGMAEYYSKNLSREVAKGMKENALKAKHNGGIPPFGYDVDEDLNYVINETEAKAVRYIFDHYLKGEGLATIARALNQKGYITKKGNAFGTSAIRDIINNEKYCGVYEYFISTKSRLSDKPEKIRHEDAIPAIISKEEWNATQAIMKKNRRSGGAFTAKTTYLLSGKIYCDKCGSLMRGKRAKKGYYYYVCSARKKGAYCDQDHLRKEEIEELVVNYVFAQIASKEAIEAISEEIYKQMADSKKEIPEEVERLAKAKEEVQKKIEGYLRLIESGTFRPSMMEAYDELEAKLNLLDGEIEKQKKKEDLRNFTKAEVQEFIERFAQVNLNNPEAVKKALEVLVDKVIIKEGKIEIHSLFVAPLVERVNLNAMRGKTLLLVAAILGHREWAELISTLKK